MTERATAAPRFSVIVASRRRPSWLKRCLSALRQQDYPAFEIVVVADPESLRLVDAADMKTVPFETANLAAARNVGVAHSGGEVCAFIDDDAAAEPLWLRHLQRAFEATDAAAVVGFVRGRNGISFQSRVSSVDAEAETHEEPFSDEEPSVPVVSEGRAVKLVGTNMAIRRETLEETGGFDEAFRYFLEDADISLRLARRGLPIAVAPLARVHHGFAHSHRRTGLRAPLDLFDIGRSTSHYLRKHLGRADQELWERIEHRERTRLLRHMVAGTCEPRDVHARLARLRAGWEDGLRTEPVPNSAARREKVEFGQHPSRSSGHIVFASKWMVRRRGLIRDASKIARSGGRASVFSFSLTPLRHHVRYADGGFWLQTGGVFGKSDRDGPAFTWCRFARRLDREIRRVAKERGIGDSEDG